MYSHLFLAKFGTTPEKLARGRDIISRDHLESSTETVSSSNGILPSAALGWFGSSSSAFPGMSSAPSKPLSQGNKPKTSLDARGLKSALSEDKTTPFDYEGVLRKFFQVNAPEKMCDVHQYLQKYSGKEAEMFVALVSAKSY